MPKPLACLNKYHRQMMLFACGETSQLSTDSSTHNSESALQNAMLGSIRMNKTPSSYKRKRTLSTTPSMNFIKNNNLQSNNTSKFYSNEISKTNSNRKRVLTFNLNGTLKTNLIQSKPYLRQRTGSESLLPSLKKFWEENFIDLGDNDKQANQQSNNLYRVSATSLPNSPQNTSKSFNCINNRDSIEAFYNESNYKISRIPSESHAVDINDSTSVKDTRV